MSLETQPLQMCDGAWQPSQSVTHLTLLVLVTLEAHSVGGRRTMGLASPGDHLLTLDQLPTHLGLSLCCELSADLLACTGWGGGGGSGPALRGLDADLEEGLVDSDPRGRAGAHQARRGRWWMPG